MIRAHMSFGLPYQGIQVISLLKDSIAPIFIGFLLGTADVGYITWANMIAAYPVLILFVLQRLYMPAFAQVQNHRAQLIALAENVIWATNAIAAPLAILTLVMIVPITTLVYGTKWLVALPYFYLFWGANLFVPSATPAMGLLNALGKSKIALLFAFIWMAGTWIIGAPLILLWCHRVCDRKPGRDVQCLLVIQGRAAASSIPLAASHRSSLGHRGDQRNFRRSHLPPARSPSHPDCRVIWDRWPARTWIGFVSFLQR